MQKQNISILAALVFAAPFSAALAARYNLTTITVPSAGPGTAVQVNGINDTGQVVGTFTPANSNSQGFTEVLATGTVTTFNGNSFRTLGNGINNQGEVTDAGLRTGGFVGYTRDPVSGAFTNLPHPQNSSSGFSASGINDAGQIVGNFNDSNNNVNGFVATPTVIAAVPEPASFALLGGGICVLASAGRREMAAIVRADRD